MTKVPLEEHLAHPLRSFMEELYHARKERHSVQTTGLYFVNEPCRYFLKFCPNIRRTPCLQIGGLPFPHTCLLYSAVCQPRPSQRLLARSYPHPWLSVSSLLYYRFLLPFTKSSEITKIPCTIAKVETGKRNEYSLKYRGEDVTEGILKTSGLFAFSAARLHVARDQLLCHYPHYILDFSLETGVYGLLNLLKISRHSQPSIIIATTIVIFIGHLLHCIISPSSKTMPERSSLTRQSGSQTRALGKDEV